MSEGYDVLIKGGSIYDGVSEDPFMADLGIIKDKIERIGILNEPAAKIIVAQGLTVMPGFIDLHTHCDSPFMLSRRFRERAPEVPSVKGNWNYLLQGVTTVVSGNCGSGFVDLNQWFEYLEKLNFGTNVLHLAPHGQIRTTLFGDQQPLVPTAVQLEALKAKTAEIMEMGAVGLSTGLEYAPGFLVEKEEIIAMTKIAGRYGGLYTSHIRNQSGQVLEDQDRGLLKSLREAFEIGREAEVPVHISHLKISAPYEGLKADQVLDLFERARAQGLEVTADQYPYTASSAPLTLLVPTHFLNYAGIKEEFKTKDGWQVISRSAASVFTFLPPEKILISECRSNHEFEGLNLTEISKNISRNPEDVFADLVSAERPPLAVYFSVQPEAMREMMPQSYVLTASDGWTCLKDHLKPHPRCYGTFIRKIKNYSLDEKVISLGAAVRSMTSLPAAKFNIKKRGRISEGHYADLTILNLDRLSDEADYLDPHRYPKGVEYVLVNGCISVEKGKPTSLEAGRPIRRGEV
jgi:N-acyl-D-amino-acid deacylase